MSNSVRPHRQQPTRNPRPWDSPGKNTGVGCHFFPQCMKGKVKVKLLNCVRLCATPETAAHQAPLSLGFSRQEHWSGLPFPSPMHESEREVAQLCPTLLTPWTAAYQAPPSMGFSRQEYWGGLPLLSLENTPAAAAAAAKSLQSCPTLCDPIDNSPPGSPIPGIFQARTLEWVAISFSNA